MNTHPIDRVIDALRAHGCKPKRSGKGWSCHCPAHQDTDPSLTVTEGADGRVLIHCHAGCAPESIVGALGMSMRDLMPGSPQPPRAKPAPKPSAVYGTSNAATAELERRVGRTADHRAAYRDAHGEIVGEVLRWNKPNGKRQAIWPIARAGTGWVIGGMPLPRPLYRLPELLATPAGAWLYVVEGEVKADKAAEIGLVVTASPHGSESAHQADWSPTRERVIVITPDHDAAGEGYAADVARLVFAAKADSVRIVRLPGLAEGDDIADFISARRAAGASDDEIRDEIQTLAEAAEPLQPPDVEPEAAATEFAPIDVTDLIRDFPEMRTPVIHGLLRLGEVGNVVAASKAKKTWLIHSAAVAVASGRDWLGFGTTAGKVLIIDAELHKETLSHRMRRAIEAAGLKPADLAGKLVVWPVRGKRLTIDDLSSLLARVKHGEYRLVVLDALYRFLPTDGKESENSNAMMTRVYCTADALTERLGAAVLVVHHTSKGDQSGRAVTDVGAGAGAQSRAADLHLILRAHKEEGAVVVEAALRSWKPINPFVIRWTDPGWSLAPDLDPKDLARPAPRARAKANTDDKPPKPVWTLETFVAKFITAKPRSMDAIQVAAREVNIALGLSKKLVRAGVEAGLVHEWRYARSNRIDYAKLPQPVTATTDPVGVCVSRARTPHNPRGGKRRSGAGPKGRAEERRPPIQKPPDEPPSDGATP